MNVVVDANLVAALALPLPYSDQAADKMRQWKLAGDQVTAPLLLEYELSTILRRAVAAGLLANDPAAAIMEQLLALGITTVPPTAGLHRQALLWAERLGQAKSYDAHYLAVAEQQAAELWTADRRLAGRADQLSLPWVRDLAADG
jgi:predicted nucleic acid-binding protein